MVLDGCYGTHCHFSRLAGQLSRLPVCPTEDGVVIRFAAEPGLYQFSVVADAREFDWEELYIELNAFHNEGKRTGPWDFHLLEGNRPLVPSYWVYLDGQKLGLWFFQRVSVEDIEARRFRGRMAFWLRQGGEHELKFVPYRPMTLRWMSPRLEPDPEDELLADAPSGADNSRYGREYWAEKKALLETTHVHYREPLSRAFEAVLSIEEPEPNEWLILLAAYFLRENQEALHKLLAAVDQYLAKPAWNNPLEDGFGHDGDMGAAFALRGFALALLSLGDELGDERRRQMQDKVVLQGRRFLNKALQDRDYWGGSLLQDHGWRSVLSFCCAAIRLQPILPEAGEWLRYILPRAHRAFAAMPRDGVVPESSHNSMVLYLDDVSELRDALLEWNGEDLYEAYPFREVVNYAAAVHVPAGYVSLVGGSGFFNQIASKYGDRTAAGVQSRLLEAPEFDWPHQVVRIGYYSGIVRGFMTYDPATPPDDALQCAPGHWFRDSGLVHYRNAGAGVTFTARCGPWIGMHADRHATGPCDRMGLAPGAGHFTLSRDGVDLLATPDCGYSIQSALRSCLLIDGRGQKDDIGYPMALASKIHRGEAIESVRWHEASQSGYIRLQLAPAYPEAAGVAAYTREFLISPRQLIVRDYVVLDEAKPLTWLFQLKRENGIALSAGNDSSGAINAEIGGIHGLHWSVQAEAVELRAEIRPTPVVWSYTSINGFKPFDSLCVHTVTPVADVAIDFVIQW